MRITVETKAGDFFDPSTDTDDAEALAHALHAVAESHVGHVVACVDVLVIDAQGRTAAAR